MKKEKKENLTRQKQANQVYVWGEFTVPGIPACRENDRPSCMGDIILMVNLAR